MPGVRVELTEETTTLDLQEGEGPRRQCGDRWRWGRREGTCLCGVQM